MPHTLLAGSSPAFTIRVDSQYSDMRTVRTRIKIEKGRTDFSKDVPTATSASGTRMTAISMGRGTSVEGPNKVSFEPEGVRGRP